MCFRYDDKCDCAADNTCPVEYFYLNFGRKSQWIDLVSHKLVAYETSGTF